jgi:hypothetical protein
MEEEKKTEETPTSPPKEDIAKGMCSVVEAHEHDGCGLEALIGY